MDLCKVWRTASSSSAVKAAAFDVSSAKLQNLPTRQMFAAVLQMLADTDFSVQSEIIFCCCKVGTSAAYLCKHSEPESYTAKNPKSSKGKVSKCRNGFSSFNLIRCNGEQRLQLVATGSTTPEALERLQAAAAVAGWERFVVPLPAPSVEAPPRGSIQPFACCGSCTQACYLYGHHRRRAGSTLQSPSCIPRCQVGAT